MLTNFLHFLQNKPEKEKIRILWAVSAITAVFVFMIWVSSFNTYKAAFSDSLDVAAESVNNLKASVSEPVQKEQEARQIPANKSTEADAPLIPIDASNMSDKPYLPNKVNPNGVSAAETAEEEAKQDNMSTGKALRLPVD